MLFPAIALNNATSEAVFSWCFTIICNISVEIPPPFVCAEAEYEKVMAIAGTSNKFAILTNLFFFVIVFKSQKGVPVTARPHYG